MKPENIIDTVNPYNNPESRNRKGIFVKGSWDNAIHRYMKENQIEALYINWTKGWESNDYSFLSKLNEVKELNIITGGGDLSSISEMSNLEDLSISYSYDGIIDFSKLKKLKTCFIGYSKKIDSLFELISLEHLSLNDFKYKNFHRIGDLTNLKSLTISNSSIDSLDFLRHLKLEKLDLTICKKLISFEEIGEQYDLKKLIIDGCKKLYDLKFVANLKKLEWLDLSYNKNLKSILPLKDCIQLQELMIVADSTIDDGDLSVLKDLQNLKILMLANRKHYNLKIKDKVKYNISKGETSFELIQKQS